MGYEVAKKKPFSVVIQSDAYQKLINNTLRDKNVANKFVANIMAAVSSTPSLSECDAGTILSAGLEAQALGLPISNTMGFCYILPRGNRAQFQIGYKGIIQMALATGAYKRLGVTEVHGADDKATKDEYGEIVVQFSDKIDYDTPVTGYYAYLELTNGFKKTEYWSLAKVNAHRERFSKAKSGSWYTDFTQMAKKTALKSLVSRWGYMTTDMKSGFEADQAVIRGDGSYDYVDNPNNADGEEEKTTVDNSLEGLVQGEVPSDTAEEKKGEQE